MRDDPNRVKIAVMKRLRRWLFNGLAAISLLVLLGLGGLIIRGTFVCEAVAINLHRQYRIGIEKSDVGIGSMVQFRPRWSESPDGVVTYEERATLPQPTLWWRFSYWTYPSRPSAGRFWLHFESQQPQIVTPGSMGIKFPFPPWKPTGKGTTRAYVHGLPTIQSWYLFIPDWVILGYAAAVFWWSWGRGRPDGDPGTCRACGYDLRATPGRCPECGTVPASEKSISR
jgi:hypothetical protein